MTKKIYLEPSKSVLGRSIFHYSLLHEILGNISTAIIFFPICDVINFEINLSFGIKPFPYIFKKSGQKCIYPKYGKSF